MPCMMPGLYVQAVYHGFGITVRTKDLIKDSKSMQHAISTILSDPKFAVTFFAAFFCCKHASALHLTSARLQLELSTESIEACLWRSSEHKRA